ncbi:sigma-B regulation protein RsbQ [Paraburkholderia sp. BL6669N2]|uniref:alpha/beta fold hydrolase n=1 Tax=unclassified Paraburkholderia TaxID=2615204 RepID=UPI000D05DB39|nr:MULTISPECIES: alpha/beta hydrolase [unclassified Paraburkholderia]PRY08656.1 sigma-B regulation protein RsbQ [Paraburkholderia sp. BL25I1N1]REG49957.1 sigma-B regulation protein RsbQ [Paraburkholderia sp. BL6669N2]TDY21756.1 sigma-B regulation protein RsbQ [Paraburkholderia sp. BL6665CI2N2]
MSITQRNNIQISGNGKRTMVLAHGFGCDQSMWRYLAPSFQDEYRTVVFDHVGSGSSDLSAYDIDKYDSLYGYASDLIEIIREVADGPVVFVGHSVSAMIGLIASLKAPQLFSALIMVGPSPCYVNDGDYVGGFSREDIEDLLRTLESNYLGWSSAMAPAIMGAPEQPELGVELTNSFCRTDPEIARQFARVTFLSDQRAILSRATTPTLILQSSDDIIAPCVVGEYLHRTIPGSTLHLIENVGHCPHLSAPSASAAAMNSFLAPMSL